MRLDLELGTLRAFAREAQSFVTPQTDPPVVVVVVRGVWGSEEARDMREVGLQTQVLPGETKLDVVVVVAVVAVCCSGVASLLVDA